MDGKEGECPETEIWFFKYVNRIFRVQLLFFFLMGETLKIQKLGCMVLDLLIPQTPRPPPTAKSGG